ncbi:DUF4306 domain-containing protein [Planococcus sp. ISL-110]|uniref:DUF4306 domain-containing protein n=1 Tax=Planococcus sp. ISL-110 TaxID=2819167 RepID=UPI001BEA2E54|nr:DUF4306 domain-containing protein [Planococcus sp. ISL-110]MBT2569746.1 DUF4306 domain-containing protein [Planococcus sp. ISL-110]
MHSGTDKKSKQAILFFGALIFFAIATFFSLYEGSQLDDVSWEWPYSAVFTNWLNGRVTSADDILTIDYLVYAAKFEPLFPIIMFISGMILFLQLSFWAFNGRKTALSVFLLVFAIALLVLSGALMASPTDGLELFSRIFLGTGVLLMIGCIFWLIKTGKLRG